MPAIAPVGSTVRPRYSRALLTAAAAGAVGGGALALANAGTTWLAYAGHGTTLPYTALGIISALTTLATTFLFGASLIAVLVPEARRTAGVILVASAVFSGCLYAGMQLSQAVRFSGLYRITVNARPLVSAIRRYETAEGHSPASLDALIPKYLEAVPNTGAGVSPRFFYKTDAPISKAWMLYVDVSPFGVLNWDDFEYHSDQLYPRASQLIGDWAYYFG